MTTNQKHYTFVAILLHWTLFFLLGFAVWLGWSTDDLKGQELFERMQLHKSVGITILFLSVFRLFWRKVKTPPSPPEGMSVRDLKIMKATHIAFYILMIGIPLLGWVIISTSSYKIPTMVWGAFEWPLLPLGDLSFRKPLHVVAEFFHSKLVWVGIILMVLHAAAAIKHQYIDKDGVLSRMLPFLK